MSCACDTSMHSSSSGAASSTCRISRSVWTSCPVWKWNTTGRTDVGAELAQRLRGRGEAVDFIGRRRAILGPLRRHDHEGVRPDVRRELDAPAVDFKDHRIVGEVPALAAHARHRQAGRLRDRGHALGRAEPVERLPHLPAVPAGLLDLRRACARDQAWVPTRACCRRASRQPRLSRSATRSG